MITPDKIKDAIYSLLCEAFPGVEVYIDLMPEGFTRPALLLAINEIATRDVNNSTIEEVLKVGITCYVKTDEHGSRPDNDLSQMSERVRVIFRDGTIYIEGRAPRCTVVQKKDANMMGVELTVSYWEQRREAVNLPTMGSIEISEKREEGE